MTYLVVSVVVAVSAALAVGLMLLLTPIRDRLEGLHDQEPRRAIRLVLWAEIMATNVLSLPGLAVVMASGGIAIVAVFTYDYTVRSLRAFLRWLEGDGPRRFALLLVGVMVVAGIVSGATGNWRQAVICAWCCVGLLFIALTPIARRSH